MREMARDLRAGQEEGPFPLGSKDLHPVGSEGIFQGFLWEGDLFSFVLEKIALRLCWGVGVGWIKKRLDTGRSFRQRVRQFRQQTTRTAAEGRDRHTSALMDDGVSRQRRESSVRPVSPRLRGADSRSAPAMPWCPWALYTKSIGSAFSGQRVQTPRPPCMPRLLLGRRRTLCNYTARVPPSSPQMLNRLISVEIFLQASMTQALNQFEIHCLPIHKERVRGGRAPIILISQGGRTGCDGLGLLWGDAGSHYGEGVRGSRPRKRARC